MSDSVPAECWNFTYGDPTNMEFFSPNFPNLYPNNVICAHYIEGKSKENSRLFPLSLTRYMLLLITEFNVTGHIYNGPSLLY